MRVDTNISDIFFNTDVSDAKVYENGQFSGFDEAKLTYEAEMVLGNLQRLGVATPEPADLIADFYGRI